MRRALIPLPVFCVFLLCFTLLSGSQRDALAHGVRVFAYTIGPDIVVEGKFANNRATQNSKVTVFSQKTGKQLVEGTTNSEGIFRFARPHVDAGDSLKVVLLAGEGHRAQWIMTPEDLGEEPLPEPAAAAPAPAAAQEESVADAATPSGAQAAPAIDTRELAQLVQQSVAREIEPLKRMMMEQMNRGPSMRDILGGIGWLVGIAGLLAALVAQKKKK